MISDKKLREKIRRTGHLHQAEVFIFGMLAVWLLNSLIRRREFRKSYRGQRPIAKKKKNRETKKKTKIKTTRVA